MKKVPDKVSINYQNLLSSIADTFSLGRQKAVMAVNSNMIDTYWKIGQYIVEYEQAGEARAEYGKSLLPNLCKDLTNNLGKGFSLSNMKRMRQLYKVYPIGAEVPHQLSWTHLVELLKIRDPYVLDFLKIPEPNHLTETELEKRLIEHLQHFLLELGKGFAFIARQYRITLGNRNHYVDLVFYHRILKCFVLIDLKREEAGYEDIGQMNMYLGYFENEENTKGDNPPVGIVLAREKDELLIQYALHNISSQLFVSKYQVYLPKKEELRKVIESELK